MSTGSSRPVHVVQRDRTVATLLEAGPQPLARLTEQLTLTGTEVKKHDVYRSLCRLRNRGLAEKTGTGSRTPDWQLTPEGVVFAQQVHTEDANAAAAAAAQAIITPPEPVEPGVVVPPPVEPPPVHVI